MQWKESKGGLGVLAATGDQWQSELPYLQAVVGSAKGFKLEMGAIGGLIISVV